MPVPSKAETKAFLLENRAFFRYVLTFGYAKNYTADQRAFLIYFRDSGNGDILNDYASELTRLLLPKNANQPPKSALRDKSKAKKKKVTIDESLYRWRDAWKIEEQDDQLFDATLDKILEDEAVRQFIMDSRQHPVFCFWKRPEEMTVLTVINRLKNAITRLVGEDQERATFVHAELTSMQAELTNMKRQILTTPEEQLNQTLTDLEARFQARLKIINRWFDSGLYGTVSDLRNRAIERRRLGFTKSASRAEGLVAALVQQLESNVENQIDAFKEAVKPLLAEGDAFLTQAEEIHRFTNSAIEFDGQLDYLQSSINANGAFPKLQQRFKAMHQSLLDLKDQLLVSEITRETFIEQGNAVLEALEALKQAINEVKKTDVYQQCFALPESVSTYLFSRLSSDNATNESSCLSVRNHPIPCRFDKTQVLVEDYQKRYPNLVDALLVGTEDQQAIDARVAFVQEVKTLNDRMASPQISKMMAALLDIDNKSSDFKKRGYVQEEKAARKLFIDLNNCMDQYLATGNVRVYKALCTQCIREAKNGVLGKDRGFNYFLNGLLRFFGVKEDKLYQSETMQKIGLFKAGVDKLEDEPKPAPTPEASKGQESS